MSENTTATTSKITVLGKTFNSDNERRTWFRDELRRKLPELKKMEGFPIGEDEDILNLSDPPYYTACPNPWLNDFIAEWEEEKKELEKQGKRKADFEVTEPFATDVSEGKNNPVYSAHSYHTKVPHPAIMRFILHYTQPQDILFDGFSGTGMLGVAASLCGKPDLETKYKIEQEFEQQNKIPQWGERKSILNDLSPISSFIASNYTLNLRKSEFHVLANNLLNKLSEEYLWMYETIHETNGQIGIINFTVWSEIHSCLNCNSEFEFSSVFMNQSTKKYNDSPSCPHCAAALSKSSSSIVYESYYDAKLNSVLQKPKRVPILINYTYNGSKFEKKPDLKDFDVLNRVENIVLNYNYPSGKIPEMQMIKVGRMQPTKISHLHHFFMKRQLILISALWEKSIEIEDTRMKNAMLFFVEQTIWGMSLLNRYSPTHFSQVNRALSGVFYVAAHVSEVSPWYILTGKLNRLIKAYNFLNSNNGTSLVSVGANQSIPLDDSCIDYIFTDPPFGENIYYSDLNLLLESWHRVISNSIPEAIVDKVKLKTSFQYQNLMFQCFKENYRILKPGKWMTVEFSNTKAEIWNGIRTAIQNAGFVLSNVTALDKKQGTFQSVNSGTAVTQDLVISCYKPSSIFDEKLKQHQNSPVIVWDFIDEHLHHLPIHLMVRNSTIAIVERSPKILFDRLIAFYIQKGLPVPIDAGKFQQGLRERFIERDGMFFTNEQVQEYDTKKAAVPNFTQLSIFVANEQDSIYWLRALLEKEPKTEQDIHPFWMKEVAGNMRSGDVLPEMRTILEENFLKDDHGKWYVPDPENEADLEKLRNKRLLRQFETYKTEAAKPRSKIKEVRVEALRAGFKQCYHDKDFKTIVTIGDRIPNNLLMEDEVLLQFYDIASSRV